MALASVATAMTAPIQGIDRVNRRASFFPA
jgi:hypothetical protein